MRGRQQGRSGMGVRKAGGQAEGVSSGGGQLFGGVGTVGKGRHQRLKACGGAGRRVGQC